MPESYHRPFIYTPPTEPFLNVLHADDHILVLDKPAGLLCVTGKTPDLFDCLEYRAQKHYPEATIVHRLDMSTSGILLMAMNIDAHRNLSRQFEQRKTTKTYIAKIWGKPEAQSGHIDLPLCCDWPNRPRQMVDHERGRASQTDWEVMQYEDKHTRVRLRPITGRSHQLRVHMQSLGHPILGDEFYAHEKAYQASDRLCLHALSLSFHHPEDGRIVTFETPCPF